MTKKIIGAVVGGVLGFAYFQLVGCENGACPITSNPWSSVGYGVFVGILVA